MIITIIVIMIIILTSDIIVCYSRQVSGIYCQCWSQSMVQHHATGECYECWLCYRKQNNNSREKKLLQVAQLSDIATTYTTSTNNKKCCAATLFWENKTKHAKKKQAYRFVFFFSYLPACFIPLSLYIGYFFILLVFPSFSKVFVWL